MSRKVKNSPVLSELNKQQKAAQEDFEKRLKPFREEVTNSCRKWMIDISATLDYKPNGVFPVPFFMDMRKHYENLAKQEEDKKTPKGLIT